MAVQNYTDNKEYARNFWAMVHGNANAVVNLHDGRDTTTGTYRLPADTYEKYTKARNAKSLFRKIATVKNPPSGDSCLFLSDSENTVQWVDSQNVDLFENIEDFRSFRISAHKAALVAKLDEDFVSDVGFDVEEHLVEQLSEDFARAEETAFINGNGINEPCGILHATKGAGVGAEGLLTFENIIRLYYSVEDKYSKNGAWLMNRRTAMALRFLKNDGGDYVWNHFNDTIFDCPVYISEFMPDEGAVMAYGDFRYYTIVDRLPLTMRLLYEKFIMEHRIGCIAYEYLDGVLTRPEAVKVLRTA